MTISSAMIRFLQERGFSGVILHVGGIKIERGETIEEYRDAIVLQSPNPDFLPVLTPHLNGWDLRMLNLGVIEVVHYYGYYNLPEKSAG